VSDAFSGAALWTALIAKDARLNIVKVQYGANLGVIITAGPSLCESKEKDVNVELTGRLGVGLVCPRLAVGPPLRDCLLHVPPQLGRSSSKSTIIPIFLFTTSLAPRPA
jgi:hypothetical protein